MRPRPDVRDLTCPLGLQIEVNATQSGEALT